MILILMKIITTKMLVKNKLIKVLWKKKKKLLFQHQEIE